MRYVIISLFAIFYFVTGVHADVLLITNKHVNEKTLSTYDIKDIFLGKKLKWQDGSKINVVISGDAKVHHAFLRTYIKKSPQQYSCYWKHMLFTGKGTPPVKIQTTQAIIKYVAETQGAIGYVDSDSTVENVNTISVE